MKKTAYPGTWINEEVIFFNNGHPKTSSSRTNLEYGSNLTYRDLVNEKKIKITVMAKNKFGREIINYAGHLNNHRQKECSLRAMGLWLKVKITLTHNDTTLDVISFLKPIQEKDGELIVEIQYLAQDSYFCTNTYKLPINRW